MKKIAIALVVSVAVCGSTYAASGAFHALTELVPASIMDATVFAAPATAEKVAVSDKSASQKVKCNVQSLADAEKCMEKVAKVRPSYEEPNDGFAVARVDGLVNALKLLTNKGKTIQQAEKADFAGLMVDNGDEYHVCYFAINKGNDVTPVELYDLNVVDFEYILTRPYSSQALEPATYFLGLNASQLGGVYSDVKERLAELSNN